MGSEHNSTMPWKMVVDQNIHRQVEYSTMKPPIIGPTAEPVSGTSMYRLSERPLCSGRHTSPRTPYPRVYTALAPKPARRREAMSRPFEVAKPQMRFQAKNQIFVMWIMDFLP